jgi:superfamily II DNA or RNA helicase
VTAGRSVQVSYAPLYPADVSVFGELHRGGRWVVLYAVGDPGALGRVALRLGTLTPLFTTTAKIPEIGVPGGLATRLSWATVSQLAFTFGASWQPGPELTYWIRAEAARRFADYAGTTAADLGITLPGGFEPYPWQLPGARMMAEWPVLLQDDPGTGKTTTGALGIAARIAAGLPTLPALVVSPNADVSDAWVATLNRFGAVNGGWRAVPWRGTPAQRATLALKGEPAVYVTEYRMTWRDAPAGGKGPLHTLAPAYVVVDEAHHLKARQGKESLAVRRIASKAAAVAGLTGTPIAHHPGDLWPMLAAMAPDAWPSGERWDDRYLDTAPDEYGMPDVLGLRPDREPELRTALLGQVRRVAEQEAMPFLPPAVYYTRTVEMPAKWRELYDRMEREMLAELDTGEAIMAMTVLVKLSRLAQLASAAAVDVETWWAPNKSGEETMHQKVTLGRPCWKTDAVLDIISEERALDSRVQFVAMAESKQLTELVAEELTENGYRVGRIVGGQTGVKGREYRAQVKADLETGALDVVACTVGAGGEGVDGLQAAAVQIVLQRPFGFIQSVQMEKRQRRLGSERHASIRYYDVITKDTVDTRRREVLIGKAEQAGAWLQDPRIVREMFGGTQRKAR